MPGYATKLRAIMYGDTSKYDYNDHSWSHPNTNKMFKEKHERRSRKMLNRFSTNMAILGTFHIRRKVLDSTT